MYVDDLLFIGSSSSLCDYFKAQMKKEFDMIDLVFTSYLLGMKVHQKHDEIFIFQIKYSRDMLNKFCISEYKLVATLIAYG